MVDENSLEKFNWIVQTYDVNDGELYNFVIQDRTYYEAVKEAEADIERDSEVEDWTITKHF